MSAQQVTLTVDGITAAEFAEIRAAIEARGTILDIHTKALSDTASNSIAVQARLAAALNDYEATLADARDNAPAAFAGDPAVLKAWIVRDLWPLVSKTGAAVARLARHSIGQFDTPGPDDE